MTTTNEQFVSDNSELKEVENNSVENSSEEQKTALNKEPEIKSDEAVKESKSVIEQEIDMPEKFKNKDGSPNIQALLKSYKELEPLINEKADWIKDKTELEKQLIKFKYPDFSSDLSNIMVKLYEKNLEKSNETEKVKILLENLKENVTPELLQKLESFFPTDVIKNIFLEANQIKCIDEMKNKIEIQKKEEENVKDYLTKVVDNNFEMLKNPAITGIFSEAFIRFGSQFDSDWFFEKMAELKKSFIMEYIKEENFKSEKENAILSATKLSPNNAVMGGVPLLQRNALDLSPQELDRMLDEYYAK